MLGCSVENYVKASFPMQTTSLSEKAKVLDLGMKLVLVLLFQHKAMNYKIWYTHNGYGLISESYSCIPMSPQMTTI